MHASDVLQEKPSTDASLRRFLSVKPKSNKNPLSIRVMMVFQHDVPSHRIFDDLVEYHIEPRLFHPEVPPILVGVGAIVSAEYLHD